MKPEQRKESARAGLLEHVMALMRDNGQLTRRIFRQRMKAMQLTGTEARTLMYLGTNQGIAQIRLAEIMEIQPIVLSRIVDRLAEAGWLERRLSDIDRRLRLLYLTSEGTTLLRQLKRVHHELHGGLTASFSEEELTQLAASLERVNAALREASQAPSPQ
jgi:MarR family transcriptional regulator, transcriptional regulator for hemolysin